MGCFLEIELYHQYYEFDFLRVIDAVPVGETQDVFNRYNIIMRKQSRSVLFFYNGIEPFEKLIPIFTDKLKNECLEFRLISSDVDLYMVSDFPLGWIGVAEFNNFDKQLKEIDGVEFRAPILKLGVKPSGLEIGKILLDINTLASDAVGHVCRYKFGIASRKTKWVYYVDKKVLNCSTKILFIKSEDGVEFLPSKNKEISNDKNFCVFDSGTSTFPILQRDSSKLSLLQRSDASSNIGEKVIVDRLPLPSANKIDVIDVNGKKQFCSKMYVYP